MFLITYTYIKPLEIVDQFLVEHRAYLDQYYQNNCFVVSGPKIPREGAILLSQLQDREQLEKILQADPFVINHVVNYKIEEFSPVKHHQNFKPFLQESI
jgi:uncharacterized protein YciI